MRKEYMRLPSGIFNESKIKYVAKKGDTIMCPKCRHLTKFGQRCSCGENPTYEDDVTMGLYLLPHSWRTV